MSTQELVNTIIKRTLRVPSPAGTLVDGKHYEVSAKLSRQLDVALLALGYKASAELLNKVARLEPIVAKGLTTDIVVAAQELKGAHRSHNTYFKDFPENVPDTIEFWTGLIEKTYGSTEAAPLFINLLDLNEYGEYQHSYEEMVAAHAPFVETGKEKITILHLGDSLQEEATKLYTSLASAKVVLNGDDLELLKNLAEVCIDYEQPEKIPVRENKAVINAVRIESDMPLLVDTVTDVLRLAAQLSGSDVTLNTKPKFKSFSGKYRRSILRALDKLVKENPAKLGDVYKNRELVKRLFQYLSSTAFYPDAAKVLQAAREGENTSFEARLEKAFKVGKTKEAVKVLQHNPGLFVRSLNRVLLSAKISDIKSISTSFEKVLPKVSTPVLIGLAQYLRNRGEQKTNRLFINRKGTGHVVKDEQPVLPETLVDPIRAMLDKEITTRFPAGTYIVNEDICNVAIPLSNKMTGTGFGIVPRGTAEKIDGEVLRLFIYWKQKKMQTDYDLSVVMLNKDFAEIGHVSYTNLKSTGIRHSGDITNAPRGASEFVDIELGTLDKNVAYLVPQVNMYGGEKYDEIEESFFGYMVQDKSQFGKPFEAKTVVTKSEMRGPNNVALPGLVVREEDNTWTLRQVNMFLQGASWGNATENNAVTTAKLMQSIAETQYLTVAYLVNLLMNRLDITFWYANQIEHAELTDTRLAESKLPENAKLNPLIPALQEGVDIFYISRQTPEGLRKDIKTINLNNLYELIP